jgi:hypothetical protein
MYSHSQNKTVLISSTKYNDITRQCELYKDSNFVVTSSLLSFYIPLLIMLFLYTKVFYAIKQQLLIRHKPSNTNRSNDDDKIQQREMIPTHDDLSSSDPQQLRRREITAEARITRSLAIVIGCFICCWFPFFTLYIIRSICRCLSFNAIEFFVWLGYSNSSLNPVLYAILNKNFRLAFKNIFMSFKKLCFI